MLIAICDDLTDRGKEWRTDLQKLLPEHDVQLLEDFETEYRGLNGRRQSARGNKGDDTPVPLSDLPADQPEKELMIDGVDVLVVDYDLLYFDENAYLTGAIVAYLARCYSSCGVIVGVNEFGPNPFDLTLTGNKASFADVSIGERQLLNPALWGKGRGDFRPWSWPDVIDLVDRHRRRMDLVGGNLGDHVTDMVDLADAVPLLPRSVVGLLERAGQPEVSTTLEDLARGPRLGLRRSDQPLSRTNLERIAAARTAKWLESAILPLQDVLIDAPHLVARHPGLLADTADEAAWERTAAIPAEHNDLGLDHEAARAHRYEPGVWLSRPAFREYRLRDDPRTPGVRDPWTFQGPQLVFCEDTSHFTAPEHARRFVTELESRSQTRWIADQEGRPADLDDVEYTPVAYLAR